jgi:Asp-tRNA(Asn)/Glu-tRNA(Gln) amidotransferase A subunit family amidase
VKDVFDTAGIPTECGTTLLAGRVPERSARTVEAIEEAGGFVLGKTVTAELAFAAPGPTRNPWNFDRTPGGSSMGSAAGIAAGFFPLAIGTQTNSSVIMPAALCGVVGFKPSAHSISREGVMAFSPTLDQVGCFGRSVESCARLASVLGGNGLTDVRGDAPLSSPRLAVARTPDWADAAPAVREQFDADVARLREAGARVDEPELPADLDDARRVHRTIMASEGATELGPLVNPHPETASDVLRQFLAEGSSIGAERLETARRERHRLIELFARWAYGFDAILTPAAPDEAPFARTTGDPRFCTRWTLVGAPAIVLPSGLGPQRLPIGLQLVGAPGADARLVVAARWVEAQLQPPAPLWEKGL